MDNNNQPVKPTLLNDKADAAKSASSNTATTAPTENITNKETEGKVTQLNGKIKETWSKLSDSDIALYNGKRDQFFGKLKEQYGLAKEDAEKKMKTLEESCAITEKAA